MKLGKSHFMKETRWLITLILLIGSLNFTHAQGIHFEQKLTWQEVRAKAKKENKFIFLDFFHTQCFPCAMLSAFAYKDSLAGKMFAKRFVSVRVQIDSTTNDNELTRLWYTTARKLRHDFHIQIIPTFIFLSPDGKLVHRYVHRIQEGSIIAETLVQLATNALDPNKQYYSLLRQYQKRNISQALVKKLLHSAIDANEAENHIDIADQYIGSLNDNQLFTEKNLELIEAFTKKSTQKGFSVFKDYSGRVNVVLGVNRAERLVRGIIRNEEVEKYVSTGSDVDWNNIKRNIAKKYPNLPLAEEAVYGAQMLFFKESGDWIGFADAYVSYFTSALSRSDYHINNMSWSIFEHVSDPEVVQFAVKVMKYDIDHFDKNDGVAYDTYANLLYKSGKKEDAIHWQQKAMQLAPDNEAMANTLKKMQNGEKTW